MPIPNVVVVGYGYAGGGFHAPLIAATPGLHMYGVVSGRAEAREEIRQRYGGKAFAGFDQALANAQVALLFWLPPTIYTPPRALPPCGPASMW